MKLSCSFWLWDLVVKVLRLQLLWRAGDVARMCSGSCYGRELTDTKIDKKIIRFVMLLKSNAHLKVKRQWLTTKHGMDRM